MISGENEATGEGLFALRRGQRFVFIAFMVCNAYPALVVELDR